MTALADADAMRRGLSTASGRDLRGFASLLGAELDAADDSTESKFTRRLGGNNKDVNCVRAREQSDTRCLTLCSESLTLSTLTKWTTLTTGVACSCVAATRLAIVR